MNPTFPLALITAATIACAPPPAPVTPTPQCPSAVPAGQPARFASIFIDGKLVAANLEARQEQEFPETYVLVAPDPPAVAAIPAASIDLIQFLRGPDAEREFGLCPGVVAFLISTKAPS